MRIALITPGGVDRSGEYRVIPALLALIERLAARHEVRVFSLGQENEPGAWRLAGAEVHNIGARHTRTRAVRTVLRVYDSGPPDVVHAIWSGSSGLIAVAAGLLLRRPSLIHVAGGELESLPDIGFGGCLTWKGRLREKTVLRRASAVSVASAPTLEKLARLGVKAVRIPLGVDRRVWPPRAPVRRQPDRPARLIHVASLNRVKDQTTLLQAAAALARAGVGFTLDIVGEDTLGGTIQQLAQDLGLARHVRFRGFLTQSQVRPLIQEADVMVMSSRHETGPVVVLEAAMLGVPTVGTAVGHIGEWAPGAALAVPVGDAQSLASAVRQVLTDEEMRLRMAQAAQTHACAEDADNTARLFERLYQEVLSISPRARRAVS